MWDSWELFSYDIQAVLLYKPFSGDRDVTSINMESRLVEFDMNLSYQWVLPTWS